MKTQHWILLLALLFGFVLDSATSKAQTFSAQAQGTYTQIDFPGAGVLTYAAGINTVGDVSGFYYTQGQYHAFLLRGAVFTTIDYPGALATLGYGINDFGVMVGYASLTDSFEIGFSYDTQSQTFSEISYPDPNVISTWAFSINNSGTVVGTVRRDEGSNVFTIGFEFDGGTYYKVNPAGFPDTIVTGINDLGEAVGNASGHGSYQNFLYSGGRFRPLNIQGYFPQAIAINDSDIVVGVNNLQNGIVGFLYQGGITQRLRFPGAIVTWPLAINSAGEVVGYFRDESNNIHGFLWTPAADAPKE